MEIRLLLGTPISAIEADIHAALVRFFYKSVDLGDHGLIEKGITSTRQSHRYQVSLRIVHE